MHRHRHARSMGGLGYLPRVFVLLWGCRIGHTAQFVCSAEGLISSLSLIADGENQELGPIFDCDIGSILQILFAMGCFGRGHF